VSTNELTASIVFDIFARKLVQTSTLEATETAYKPIASVDQSDLGFLIPADYDTYVGLNIHLYFRGKLTKADGQTWKPRTTQQWRTISYIPYSVSAASL